MTHLTSSEIIDKVGMLTFQFVKNYICANAAVFVDAEYEDDFIIRRKNIVIGRGNIRKRKSLKLPPGA
jgi:hypothetical protein